MNIYTIGFAQKSAEVFFTLLSRYNIECLFDIRLNNVSQLAGFTKAMDLKYFLKTILNAEYIHDINYAPTKEILDNYKKGISDWNEYVLKYNNLIVNRKTELIFAEQAKNFNNVCLLCSEVTANNCHRKLLAEYLKSNLPNIEIMHI